MFEVEKVFSFEAGHILEHHDGKCAKPHGHSYRVGVAVRCESLHEEGPKRGMAVDFQEIRDIVTPMIDRYFDHKWLNETLCVASPTAEFIAEWIFHHLEPKIPGLYRITVWETANCQASYFRS